MTMAVSKAVEHGAKAVICASTGNTSASAAAYADHAGITAAVLVPEGKIAMGKLSQAIAHNAQLLQVQRQLRRLPRDRPRARRQLPGAPGELGQQRPHRGPEDGGVRGRRGARRRPRLPLHPGRQRRQLHRLLPRLPEERRARRRRRGCPGCSASRPRAARRSCAASRQGPGDHRERDPHRQPGLVGARAARRATRPTATSVRSPTTRSSPRTASCPPRSASSSSPPPRSASPACSSARGRGRSRRARPSCSP